MSWRSACGSFVPLFTNHPQCARNIGSESRKGNLLNDPAFSHVTLPGGYLPGIIQATQYAWA